MTRNRQPGMALEQQPEAAKTSPLPLGEGLGVRVEPHRGSIMFPAFNMDSPKAL